MNNIVYLTTIIGIGACYVALGIGILRILRVMDEAIRDWEE